VKSDNWLHLFSLTSITEEKSWRPILLVMLQSIIRNLAHTKLASYLQANDFASLSGLCEAFDKASSYQSTASDCLGIEFHHSDSVLDAFFYGKADVLKSKIFYCPDWIEKHFSFVEADLGLHHFPDGHYFELDKVGNSYMLAGMFQAYNPSPDAKSNIENIINYLRAIEFVVEDNPRIRSNLEFLQTTFGCPYQIGLMSGRGKIVKLVTDLSSETSVKPHKDQILKFIEECLAHQSDGFNASIRQISELITVAVEKCKTKISLDYNISEECFCPRLGIELAPRGSTRFQDCNIIQQFFRHIKDDVSSIKSFNELHGDLPFGIKLIDLHHNIIVCYATHIKLTLSRGKIALKTYLAVQASKNSGPRINGIKYLT